MILCSSASLFEMNEQPRRCRRRRLHEVETPCVRPAPNPAPPSTSTGKELLLIRVKQLIRDVPAIATADLHYRTEITSRLISLTVVTYANVADALSTAAQSAAPRRSQADAVLV